MKQTVQPTLLLSLVITIILTSFLSGCSQSAGSTTNSKSQSVAARISIPAEVKSAPIIVQQAYQFAVANPDLMKQIPCYCGCGKIGHTSNYSCYVQSVDDEGNVKYDTHALACSICIDITTDVMRMLKQGKTVNEIKESIDQIYSKYGTSNIQ